MKKNMLLITGLMIAIIFACQPAAAQRITGNKNVVSQERATETFSGIEAGGAFNVYLTTKEEASLIIETDENLLPQITTSVKNNILNISSSGIRNATRLNVYVSAPEISYINASGAATVESTNTIATDRLELVASGAADIKLEVDVDELSTEVSGAATMRLSGNAKNHQARASGASDIKAKNLQAENATANASGAASISINATGQVSRKTSGAGSVSISGSPNIVTTPEGGHTSTTFHVNDRGDTTRIIVGNKKIEVIDGDTTTINLGNRSLVVDDRGNVTWQRNAGASRRPKFNGHWAGIELGVNGFLNSDFGLDLPEEYDFLDLKYEKSIDVSINFFEQNINLINNKLGMVTGVGVRWNNYRLRDNIVLVPDSAQIFGFQDTDTKWRKSKLVTNYLQVPLLFEYQTNPYSRSNSFHVSAGMIFGWRFRTYTKMMNRESGRNVSKTKGESFHMNPFRYDATARIGWGVINLYATYSLNTLFKDDRGPEVYPFAVGVQLIGW